MATGHPTHHHPGHGSFRGAPGLLVGAALLIGRRSDARLACDLTAVGPGDHVVDIGCGPGVAVREARRRGATAIGVDPAPVMLRIARLFPRRGVSFLGGSAERLPLEEQQCTVAWSLATVHHWVDIGAGIAEAFRVLRPGGRFLGLEHQMAPASKAGNGWTEAQAETFASHCNRAGFAHARVEARPGRYPLLAVTAVKPDGNPGLLPD